MSTGVSKQEAAYGVLRARIVDGTYGPGHRLVIDALARELDVSRMPIREAIRRLEAEDWVVYQRNLGAQVAPIDGAAWTDTVRTLAVLEGHATALAAPFVDEGDMAEMRHHNQLMADALLQFDVFAASERNLAFHAVAYKRCPNGYLRRELDAIQERVTTLRGSIFAHIPMRGHVSIAEHEALLQMIERGEEALAIELAAREHKLHTVAAYEERLKQTAARR
jgi:DNA-binding GntR family transcriptional regulator